MENLLDRLSKSILDENSLQNFIMESTVDLGMVKEKRSELASLLSKNTALMNQYLLDDLHFIGAKRKIKEVGESKTPGDLSRKGPAKKRQKLVVPEMVLPPRDAFESFMGDSGPDLLLKYVNSKSGYTDTTGGPEIIDLYQILINGYTISSEVGSAGKCDAFTSMKINHGSSTDKDPIDYRLGCDVVDAIYSKLQMMFAVKIIIDKDETRSIKEFIIESDITSYDAYTGIYGNPLDQKAFHKDAFIKTFILEMLNTEVNKLYRSKIDNDKDPRWTDRMQIIVDSAKSLYNCYGGESEPIRACRFIAELVLKGLDMERSMRLCNLMQTLKVTLKNVILGNKRFETETLTSQYEDWTHDDEMDVLKGFCTYLLMQTSISASLFKLKHVESKLGMKSIDSQLDGWIGCMYRRSNVELYTYYAQLSNRLEMVTRYSKSRHLDKTYAKSLVKGLSESTKTVMNLRDTIVELDTVRPQMNLEYMGRLIESMDHLSKSVILLCHSIGFRKSDDQQSSTYERAPIYRWYKVDDNTFASKMYGSNIVTAMRILHAMHTSMMPYKFIFSLSSDYSGSKLAKTLTKDEEGKYLAPKNTSFGHDTYVRTTKILTAQSDYPSNVRNIMLAVIEAARAQLKTPSNNDTSLYKTGAVIFENSRLTRDVVISEFSMWDMRNELATTKSHRVDFMTYSDQLDTTEGIKRLRMRRTWTMKNSSLDLRTDAQRSIHSFIGVCLMKPREIPEYIATAYIVKLVLRGMEEWYAIVTTPKVTTDSSIARPIDPAIERKHLLVAMMLSIMAMAKAINRVDDTAGCIIDHFTGYQDKSHSEYFPSKTVKLSAGVFARCLKIYMKQSSLPDPLIGKKAVKPGTNFGAVFNRDTFDIYLSFMFVFLGVVSDSKKLYMDDNYVFPNNGIVPSGFTGSIEGLVNERVERMISDNSADEEEVYRGEVALVIASLGDTALQTEDEPVKRADDEQEVLSTLVIDELGLLRIDFINEFLKDNKRIVNKTFFMSALTVLSNIVGNINSNILEIYGSAPRMIMAIDRCVLLSPQDRSQIGTLSQLTVKRTSTEKRVIRDIDYFQVVHPGKHIIYISLRGLGPNIALDTIYVPNTSGDEDLSDKRDALTDIQYDEVEELVPLLVSNAAEEEEEELAFNEDEDEDEDEDEQDEAKSEEIGRENTKKTNIAREEDKPEEIDEEDIKKAYIIRKVAREDGTNYKRYQQAAAEAVEGFSSVMTISYPEHNSEKIEVCDTFMTYYRGLYRDNFYANESTPKARKARKGFCNPTYINMELCKIVRRIIDYFYVRAFCIATLPANSTIKSGALVNMTDKLLQELKVVYSDGGVDGSDTKIRATLADDEEHEYTVAYHSILGSICPIAISHVVEEIIKVLDGTSTGIPIHWYQSNVTNDEDDEDDEEEDDETPWYRFVKDDNFPEDGDLVESGEDEFDEDQYDEVENHGGEDINKNEEISENGSDEPPTESELP